MASDCKPRSIKDRQRAARLQRQRRARLVRIDYLPGPEALAAISAKRAQQRSAIESTNSAVINAIVTEWAELTGVNPLTAAGPGGGTTSQRPAHEFGNAPPEFLHPSRRRARMYESGAHLPGRCTNWPAPREASAASLRVICGARRHRDHQPCCAKSEPGKRRCRFHGGRSTGPKTAAGKARALANLRQNQHKKRT